MSKSKTFMWERFTLKNNLYLIFFLFVYFVLNPSTKNSVLPGSHVIVASTTEAMLEQLYCGQDNCYEILGVLHNATKTEIRKSYRRLSLLEHPDKNASKGAQEKFQKLAKALEVLTDETNREAYDYYLAHPGSLLSLYYGIRAHYPSQTSPSVVVILVLLFGSIGQYINWKWRRNYSVGVVTDTPQFKRALEMEIETQHGSRFKRLSDKEKDTIRQHLSILLLDTVQLNGEIIGSKPAPLLIQNIFAIWCLLLPWTVFRYLFQSIRWTIQYRILQQEYSESDKIYITCSAASFTTNQWKSLTDEQRTEWLERELWKKDKLNAYFLQKEDAERELRNSSAKYRQWKRWKKKAT